MYLLELAGEDDRFAAAEAASAATDVEVVAPGVATASAVEPDRVAGLAYTRRASELLGRTEADVEGARSLLEAVEFDRTGTVAVRARDVRGTAKIDTQAAERALGRALVDRGFAVDLEAPNHELRAVFAGETCVLGWLAVEGERGFGSRMPSDKPFFQPGSMDPLEARAVANLARARPGATFVDPMCGTGGILVEAGLVGARVVGFDAQRKMVRGARKNLERYLGEGAETAGSTPAGFDVGLADAARLPIRDGGVAAVVVDVPYGRQSKVASTDVDSLVGAAFREARRVADRAVVVADRSRESEAIGAGWTVEAVFERPVHRSLTRYVHVLDGGAVEAGGG
ncbi:MAG TPA: TIGR01177 family methyltransferase [Halobacteriales archaeon]|nr:TIGR01177 family methyltransferase [Halobacteriales archaeon]